MTEFSDVELPTPHRIVTRIGDFTEVPHYKSIERLAALLFADEILRHNHSARVEHNRCPSCGYEMNYYDVMYYTVKSGIHSRQMVKEMLKVAPLEYIDVTFRDIQCVECGTPVTVVINGYLCCWRTDQLGKDVEGEVTTPLAVR